MSQTPRTERERFQTRLLDAVGEAVIATDLAGRITYWNAAAEELYGWSAEEVLGRQVTDVTPTDMSRDLAHELMATLREGDSWRGEFMVRDRHGREFPVFVTDSPILDEDGDLVGIIGTSVEITERKSAEDRQAFLAEAGDVLTRTLDLDALLSRLLDLAVPTMGDWGYVHLPSLPPDPATRAAEGPNGDEEGRASDERTAGAMAELLDPGAESRQLLDWVRSRSDLIVLTRGSSDDARRDDGPPRAEAWLDALGSEEVVVAPMRARDHTVGVLFFGLRDGGRSYDPEARALVAELARRMAFATDNARLYHRAQAANRAKADFLAVVSHELRTPLNAITGYTDLLETGVSGTLNDDQARFVDRIHVSAHHLATIIDEILAFARARKGVEAIELGLTNISRTVSEAAAVVAPGAEARGLELRLDLPEPGPEVLTDQTKIRQIVVNLLSNAVKYTETGRVVTEVRRSDEGVTIEVRDTGIGIPESDLDHIFEPFWQSEAPDTRRSGGTGLGLSMSRRYARMLGGDLEAESEVGSGSRFMLRLPIQPPSEGT